MSRFASESANPAGIDLIIPVYRNAALTAQCLHSVAGHLSELAAHAPRLVLVNDSPDDTEVTSLLREFAQQRTDVQLIENAQNQGFIRSVNGALTGARSQGRDVILINADTQTFEGTLINLLRVAYSDPQIAFVSPRSNNASLCTLPHVHGGVLPTPAQAHAHWKPLSATMPAYHFVPTAVGFYLYIKHVVLSNFGPLDTQFGAGYEEENDLILRANRVGFRAALANHAFAYHAGSASFTLTDLDLGVHRDQNLKAMVRRHPEFLPLVRRYEDSPHFRAETLLGHSLPTADGRYKMVLDLSSMGAHVNGTSEQTAATLASLCARHRATFEVNVVCSEAAFKFHALDRIEGLRRHEAEPLTGERFALAVRIGQPFDLAAIDTLEKLAPINLYGMLDTIAEDCGYLSVTQPLEELWRHTARHSNGLFFISRFSEQIFRARFPDAQRLPNYTRLLPTRLAEYRPKRADSAAVEHVLIMGNHFAHKASVVTAEVLRAAFPTVQFVVLGKQTETRGNVRSYQSGVVAEDQIEAMYARASVIVLPSYMEGFGFGTVRALAAGKAVVARDIPATRELLATYRDVSGVFLYKDNAELVSSLKSALSLGVSRVDDTGAEGWDDWVEGFAAYCRRLVAADDLFPKLVERIRAGDLLRKANAPTTAVTKSANSVRTLKQLLALDGEEFVRTAYLAILDREADTGGLANYVAELKAGTDKFTVVERLRGSDEGQEKGRPLAGFRRAALTRRLLNPFAVK